MTTEDKIARRNPGSIEPAKGMGNLPRAAAGPPCVGREASRNPGTMKTYKDANRVKLAWER